MKIAVIYDKWLHSLGGGEVVACNMAVNLKEAGYKVIFISGKEMTPEKIYENLNIDLTGIKFMQVWNDENAIRKISKGADIFINTTFIDYNRGFAKKNYYYAHFPTKPYENFRGMLFTKFIIPIASRLVNSFESIKGIEAPIILYDNPAYLLHKDNKYAISSLKVGKVIEIELKIFIENFYKEAVSNISISLSDGQVLEKNIIVNHFLNILHYRIKFIPKAETVYLNLQIKNSRHELLDMDVGKIYLLYPKIQLKKISNLLPTNLINKINNRLRAGIFTNVLERLSSYGLIFSNSEFTKKWVSNYWKRESTVLSPPVEMLFKKLNLNKTKKKNWICSVGRFFTLGHGKKQEVLIEAFKRLHDMNKKSDWELHLVGGLGDEPSSIEFFKYLKDQVKGYPIFFHINAKRSEVEEVYKYSKIYWHATGFGESEDYLPIRFEHFGIAPIEAISAKCIPILFNGGGLSEIIDTVGLKREDNLFKSVDELIARTIFYQSVKNQKLDWESIFARIQENYSLESFKSKFTKILE